eukprot:Ihof_evm10s79 gene=Ihof_evmTU10s79
MSVLEMHIENNPTIFLMHFSGFHIDQNLYSPQLEQDISLFLKEYPCLQPSSSLFVKEAKRHRKLLCLSGTLPILFKGAPYQIPIAIYLPERYPTVPPYVYVVPTSTMLIKPSHHVGSSGQVYHAYLSNWAGKTSTLSSLLSTLQTVFGQDCPVYSKPTIGPTNIHGHHPLRPAKPDHMTPSTVSTNHTSIDKTRSNQAQSLQRPSNNIRANGPQLPPKPQVYGGPPHKPKSDESPTNPDSSMLYKPHIGPINRPNQGTNEQSLYNLTSTGHTLLYSCPPVWDAKTSERHAAHRKAVNRVETYQHQLEAEVRGDISKINRASPQLQSNSVVLDNLKVQLAEEESAVNAAIQAYQKVNRQLDETLAQHEFRVDPPIDESVITTTPLYDQLLTQVAKENSIIDTIYYLSKALNKGLIELDTFMK